MIESQKKVEINNNTVNSLWKFKGSLSNSIVLLRVVGYGLLILTLFDFVDVFIPLKIMNAGWQFQTIGQLVERAAVPLIGLVFVFFGERHDRKEWELPTLRILSFFSLVVGVLYFLLVPLAFMNTIRLYVENSRTVEAQLLQEKQQIERFQGQLQGVSSMSQMNTVVNRMVQQGMPEAIAQAPTLKGKKDGVLNFVVKQQNIKELQVKATLRSRQIGLLKNSLKWILGAVVSGVLFIILKRNTVWTRKI
ncbi:MAG: HpsJ family protein [Gomphosphaeria aponina SAG 52.96 = DSM 107014]|uniref:HpsJ family protein n=1 Tax=Gomphosphaeria aponina SAG 52.96 = DSM 107014 TaxID=1521640 RepID=A0A941GUM4_9CHRO|nr:HpsJ family protein [Gomphosphaeria aponina SAG 52.96 = DSM 107014]